MDHWFWPPSSFQIRKWLRRRTTYFFFHVLYFVVLGLFGGIIAFLIEGDTAFLDCLFMSYSACTLTGLATVDVQQWGKGSMWVLLVMMNMGNQVLLSAAPAVIRKYYYTRTFRAAHDKAQQQAIYRSVEYQGLKSIQRITLIFYASIPLLSFGILALYCTFAIPEQFLERDTSPVWFAWFMANSAWCNCGLTIFNDSLVGFQDNYCLLLCISSVTLLCDTMYPVALRFVVYVLHHIFPEHEGYKFLLKRPRRCCTHLFKSVHTRMLLACVIAFTLTGYVTFMAFEFNSDLLSDLPGHLRSLNCWFQVVATRTAGFNTIDIAALAPAVLFLVAIMMYVASYPVIAAMRQASEEERTSVAWDAEEEVAVAETLDIRRTSPNFAQQVKERCMGDLWLLVLALFIIFSLEGNHIQAGEFTMFSVTFEVLSAYGTVGLSLGYPGALTSLSGIFHPVSKIVIIIVMICGRHRGLPRSIDRAVNLESMSGDAEYALNPMGEDAVVITPLHAAHGDKSPPVLDDQPMHISFASPNRQDKTVFFKLPEEDVIAVPEPYALDEATSSSPLTRIPNPLARELNKFYTGKSSVMTFSGMNDRYRHPPLLRQSEQNPPLLRESELQPPLFPETEQRKRMKSL